VPTGWTILDSHGDAGTFHARTPDPVRSITFHTVATPTLVLGSSQPMSDVDHEVARALRIDVVQRRSGGGAVLLLPDEFVWVDVVVPADDPRWSDDVGAAMWWVGQWWADALARLGVSGRVHPGPLVRDQWSSQVCWTGIGAGEVMSMDGKLVGISQRRTRELARFQSMCHLRWRPELAAALVAPPRPAAAALAASSAVVTATADAVRAALLATLPA
jgi:lipoate-protein ligase A